MPNAGGNGVPQACAAEAGIAPVPAALSALVGLKTSWFVGRDDSLVPKPSDSLQELLLLLEEAGCAHCAQEFDCGSILAVKPTPHHGARYAVTEQPSDLLNSAVLGFNQLRSHLAFNPANFTVREVARVTGHTVLPKALIDVEVHVGGGVDRPLCHLSTQMFKLIPGSRLHMIGC